MRMKDYQEFLLAELEDLREKYIRVSDNMGVWPDKMKGRVFGLILAYEITGGDREVLARYELLGFY